MTREEIIATLSTLLPMLGGIRFGLIGSANLSIQGIDIVAGDIDFVTNDEGVQKVSEVFGSTINRDNPYIKTEFEYEGFEIEFVSNQNNPFRPVDYLDHIEMFKVGDLDVPVIALTAEHKVYSMMGRDKDRLKMGQIEELLKKE